MNSNTGAIVVASGYGSCRTTEGVPFPKVLEDVHGRVMILRVLDTVLGAGLSPCVVVVNPLFGPRIRNVVHEENPSMRFALQPSRAGACDAVRRGALAMSGVVEHFLVVYADMPLWTPATMSHLVEDHEKCHPTISMVSVRLVGSYPKELERYGRIVKSGGKILRIVEPPDASAEDLLASDAVNPSLWVWNRAWLLEHAPHVPFTAKSDGHDPEQYLPPLIGIAVADNQEVLEFPLKDPWEALGVNNANELERVREVFVRRSESISEPSSP